MPRVLVTRVYAHVTLPYDNEIQLFDACTAVAKVLTELGQKALDNGDVESLKGTYDIIADSDGEAIGSVEIREEEL